MEDNKINIKAIKLCILGDASIGKTCICNAFLNIKFIEEQIATMGADKYETKFTLNNGKDIKIILWDTSGHERFRVVDLKTAKGAQGIILVFDFTNRNSFKNLEIWLREIINNFYDDTSIVLFGNKIDMEKRIWQVTSEEARKYAEKNNLVLFETSAKTRQGIKEGFTYIANIAYSKIEKRIEKKNNIVIKPEKKTNEKCVTNKKKGK